MLSIMNIITLYLWPTIRLSGAKPIAKILDDFMESVGRTKSRRLFLAQQTQMISSFILIKPPDSTCSADC